MALFFHDSGHGRCGMSDIDHVSPAATIPGTLAGSHRFGFKEFSPREVRRALAKRGLDLALALLLLPLSLPIIGILWILTRLDGGPGFFVQTRVGKDGKPFGCLKLRTMVPNADAVLRDLCAADSAIAREWQSTQKLMNDPRITTVGRLARRTSLDELPQIFNVLKGEMSFVGPRPLVPGELARYGEHAADYLSTKPGITGLWQVSGRNRLPYEERVRLDTHYVRNWTVSLDLLIVLHTIAEVLWRRSGV